MDELKFGSQKHNMFLKELSTRINMSERAMDTHYRRFKKNEELHTGYKIPTEKDNKSRKRKAKGESDFESFVFPASYSMALSAHTYYSSVFLQRQPVFQFEGRHGEGAMKEMAMESMINYQVSTGRMMAPLMIWLLDVSKFGIGIVGDYWEEEKEYVARRERVEIITDGVGTGKFKNSIVRTPQVSYEGNKLFNIIPYNYLPDPRVPFIDPQAGEFAGRKFKLGYNTARRKEQDGIYFNVEEARNSSISNDNRQGHTTGTYVDPRSNSDSGLRSKDGKNIDEMDAVELTWELIPNEWGLGDSLYPEKWVFTVVNRKTIIGAEPLGRAHNKFPFHVLENEVDGYKQGSRSVYEISGPLNESLSWLFNSHMYNKRASLNNQFVVDPQRVVMKDVQSREPGKLIRLKPEAYGTDVRTALSQLQVADVTSENLRDASVVLEQMQQVMGINQDVGGGSSPSSRRSATEFRGTTGFSTQRLATNCLWYSITGFNSLASSLVSSTQELYTTSMKVKVAGDNIKGRDYVTVDPDRIAGKFDFTNVDGTSPMDRTQQATFMRQVLMDAYTIPGIAEEYRLSDVFAHTVRLAGLRSFDRFKINVKSDEDIVAEIERGNLVRADEGRSNGEGGGGIAESLGFAQGTNDASTGLA